jgi:LuxR family maltose regulon positive regulatory protein
LYLQGRSEQALAPLTRALTIGEAGGYVRIFTDEGPLMAQLLHFARSRLGVRHQAYLDKLLDTFTGFQFSVQSPRGTIFDLPTKDDEIVDHQSESQNLIDPLSDRELEVLHLIADGLSNQEIADELVIAVSTVKSHANKIFSKLEVQNRTQAVARARELHVL